MANFASINSEFSAGSDLDSFFKIKFVNTSRSIDLTFTWTCKSLRTLSFEYTQGSDGGEQGSNALQAVNADIANSTISSFMNVSLFIDAFAIEANENGWVITDEGSTGTTNITLTEVPEVLPAKNFELLTYTLGQAVDACANVQVTLTENDGVSPFTWISPANASTTLVADLARSASVSTISITLEDDEADQATITNVILPGTFDATLIDDISVVANAGLADSTVTVFMSNPSDLNTYTFSLDGIGFQDSNVFPNVLDGSYTLYVNDGFGCIATQAFDVVAADEIERRTPEATVPTANSIRMIQRTTNKFQSLDNTLYVNEIYHNEFKKRYFQPYQTNDDNITTQFDTNYDELSAKVLDCEGNTITTLTINKKTDNLDSRDTRDCIAYNRGNDQTGVYFTTGNIYEDGSTTEITDSYELNGLLPDWGVQGNTMTFISGQISGSFVIKQVLFDSAVNAEVLIFDNSWTSGNETEPLIVDVTYDRQNTETYEFDVDMAALAAGVYTTQLLITDSLEEFEDLAFDSESFEVRETWKGTIFLEYSVSSGTGIDYETGYTGRVRVHGLPPLQQMSVGGSVDVYNDSGENLKKVDDNPTRGGIAFFHHIPRYMQEKLRLIFSHDNYSINDQDYQNEEELELEEYNQTSLRNATIQVRTIDYQAFKNDNIDIDGQTGAILTEESGKILQE